MVLIFLFIFFLNNILPQNLNYPIALDKYEQAKRLSNREKEYLEKAALVIKNAVKQAKLINNESEEKEAVESGDSSIMDPETFCELDFISKKGEGLFYPKDAKLSYVARAFLTYLSTAQTNDEAVLEKRRSVIAYLQENPTLKAELIKIMGSLEKEAEEAFFNFSNELTEKEKKAQNNFFLKRGISNGGTLLLNAGQLSNLLEMLLPNNRYSIYFYCIAPTIFNAGCFFMENLIPERISTEVYGRYANFCSNYPLFFTSSLLVPSMMLFGLSEHLGHYPINVFLEEVNNLIFSKSTSLYVCRLLGLLLITLPGYFIARTDYYQSFFEKEKGLIFVQKAVCAAKVLDQLLEKHPDLAKNLLLAKTLKSKFDLSCNSKAAFVLNEFKNKKIQTPSVLNYCLIGSRMVVFKNLMDNPAITHDYLFPLLAGFGEIQTYSMLADQFKHYSTPQIKRDGISIQLTEFFHPNLTNCVKNSLDYVVSDDKRFVFISGANGSGKSVTARTILASLVAGQTFGLTSAKKGTVSLFDKIYFVANLSDDLGVASKFQVELAKLKKLLEYLEKNADKKVLLVMDEPLTTTNSSIAAKVLFGLFTFLKQYPNLAIISASNNSNLKDFKGVFHLGMEVEKNSDGTFKPTYKCKEGHAYMSDVMAQFIKIFGNKFNEFQEEQRSLKSAEEV